MLYRITGFFLSFLFSFSWQLQWLLENGLFSILRSLSQIAINEETAAQLVSLSGIHVSYSGNSSDYYFLERLFTCDNLLSYRGFPCEDYVLHP